jgi:Gas vesicle protein G
VDLLTLLFRLPFMPLRGFLQLAQMLQEQAEQELHDPAAVKRQLEDVEEARASGRLSDDEVSQVEYQAVGRLIQQQPPGGAPTNVRAGGKE